MRKRFIVFNSHPGVGTPLAIRSRWRIVPLSVRPLTALGQLTPRGHPGSAAGIKSDSGASTLRTCTTGGPLLGLHLLSYRRRRKQNESNCPQSGHSDTRRGSRGGDWHCSVAVRSETADTETPCQIWPRI